MAAHCSSRARSESARPASSRPCSLEAEQLGFHTLAAPPTREEGRTPYAPLVEPLEPLAARRSELAGALTDNAQAALSRLLPSVRRPAGAVEAVDRHRIFSAVAQLLAKAAAERGVVLAVDDLHAADEATAALAHHLAQCRGRAPARGRNAR